MPPIPGRPWTNPKGSPDKSPLTPAPTGFGSFLSSRRDHSRGGQPHLVVTARAGTGKTTTMIEGLKLAFGQRVTIDPSPQQRAVWDVLVPEIADGSVGFVAYNTGIADELKQKVPVQVDASTVHSMGLRAVRKRFPGATFEKKKLRTLLHGLVGPAAVAEFAGKYQGWEKATYRLTDLCRAVLVEPTRGNLMTLARTFFVDLGENDELAEVVVPAVPALMNRCLEVDDHGLIDFTDMVWLPLALDLPLYRYATLLVDEAQDLDPCRRELVLRGGWRIVVVGDDRQAIYGYSGADSESMTVMAKTLAETNRPVVTLPLTVTRRCGRRIVEEARRFVADIEAHPTNPEGEVLSAWYGVQKGRELPVNKTYIPLVRPGDMVLCRVNAPLLGECLKLLAAGTPAYVKGNDVTEAMADLIDQLSKKATDLADFRDRANQWFDRRLKKAKGEEEIAKAADIHQCLTVLMDQSEDLDDLYILCSRVLPEDGGVDDEAMVRLSSVHKAKGLEADRVFFLQPAAIPTPRPKSEMQARQEENLQYVAVTRAKSMLCIVR